MDCFWCACPRSRGEELDSEMKNAIVWKKLIKRMMLFWMFVAATTFFKETVIVLITINAGTVTRTTDIETEMEDAFN